ncbi:MAG: hypothetical protein AMXMBFR57_24080 [Acidimicrobiia bacterium]
MKWVIWLVPKSWRETVLPDLEGERVHGGRSRTWLARQVLTVGLRLRWQIGRNAMWTDLRYVLRHLWRSRWFTVAAVLMLALGLGANLAVFSVVDRALFRELPYTAEERLILVTPFTPEDGQRYTAFDRRLFVAARQGVPAISDMAYVSSFQPRSFPIPGAAGQPLVLSGASYNLLDVLGISVVRGRGFTRDAALAKEPIALITYETWQARFMGDEGVLGRQIGTGTRTVTIVGVLPQGFIRPVMNHWSKSDGILLDAETFDGPAAGNLSPGVARLTTGATADQAFTQLGALAERLDPELRRAGQSRGPRVRVDDLRQGMFAFAYQYLWLVTLAATLLVALTAANLAGLLLSRGRSRTHEVALRASLGASRLRLLTTEIGQSTVICALGAGVALLVLVWSNRSLVELVPAYMQSFVITGGGMRLVGYTALLVMLCALVSAGLPAWAASRIQLLSVLKTAAGAPAHARAGRMGHWIIGFEAAVGIVLVAGAAIVLRGYLSLATQDLGYAPEGLTQVSIGPSGDRQGGDDRAERDRYLRVLAELRRRPEVAMAAAADSTPGSGAAPMSGGTWNGVARAGLWQVTDGWLETLGFRMVAGETIREVDVLEERPVALITRDLARRVWPALSDHEVLGQTLTSEREPVRRVIGVVAETRPAPGQPTTPMVIAPVSSAGFWFLDFVVRTRPDAVIEPAAVVGQTQHLSVESATVARADRFIESVLLQPRTQTLIFGSFAVVGLLVAAVGLFAVLSLDLALRRYEFGIRASLGASRRDLVRVALSTAMIPVLAGGTVGLVTAYWSATVVQSLVVGVDAQDPGTLALVASALVGVALVAAWIPARRASRVDPAVVLRQQ